MMTFQQEKFINGRASLTPTGKRQHYILGQYFRKRYMESVENEGFLDPAIIEKQYTISSSDVSRT